MKKLTLFTTLLLLTAILCGCAAATTGNTVPTDAPTTPTTAPTQPTEPQATEPPADLEPLTIKSYSGDSLSSISGRPYLVRGHRSMPDCYTKQDEYDDAFFEENTLIFFSCVDGQGPGAHRLVFSDIIELGENQYEIVLDHYSSMNLSTALDCHGAYAEVNRVIEKDAEITVKYRGCTVNNSQWKLFNGDNEIDYTVPGEPVAHEVTKILWDGDSFGNKHLKTLEDLAELYGGNIPAELSKYDESFFADHDLYVNNAASYIDRVFEGVYLMEDGNYVIHTEYTSYRDSLQEGETVERYLHFLEIGTKIPEDVELIWLSKQVVVYFDFFEGLPRS